MLSHICIVVWAPSISIRARVCGRKSEHHYSEWLAFSAHNCLPFCLRESACRIPSRMAMIKMCIEPARESCALVNVCDVKMHVMTAQLRATNSMHTLTMT